MYFEIPHRRLNPLTGEWVLVSPHRAKRPWLGQVEKPAQEELPAYDPQCYLCPGNLRAAGRRNPDYTGTFVFDNDFPALLTPGQAGEAQPDGLSEDGNSLFRVQPEWGITRVVCFSPHHDRSLPLLSKAEVETVVRTWQDQTRQLGDVDFTAYVQVFENKGAMMGASNPHPHSQIWASSHIPNEPGKELSAQARYLEENGTCLLCDTLAAERQQAERMVLANEGFSAFVPFWAVWPFEILLVSNRHIGSLLDLSQAEIGQLADLLKGITTRYDNLFESSFPYSMGFHQAPVTGDSYPHHHFHAHFYPPLLRSATVRKFMVGYEMLAMPQRDLTPEAAAERLRSVSEVHYRSG